MGETPLLKKRMFPPYPLPQKTLNADLTDRFYQSVKSAVRKFFERVPGSGMFCA
jgi:hypothetical protein